MNAILNEIKLSRNAEALYKAMMVKLLQKGNVRQDRPKAPIEEELDQAKRRIQNLEDDFADRKIDAHSFNKSNARYTADVERSIRELNNFTSQVTNYQRFLK